MLYTAIAFSQQVQSSPSPADKNATASGAKNSQADTSGALTSDQLVTIIQQKPEVIIDLKKVMAEYLVQQSASAGQQEAVVDENSITDEMLYSGIANNADLRESMTIWLRARGYTTEIASEKSNDKSLSGSDEETDDLDLTQPTQSPLSTLSLNNDMSGIGNNTSSPNRLETDELATRQDASVQPIEKQKRTTQRQREAPAPDAIELLHATTPYNLQALRDLYTQIPEQSAKLKRFGSDVFLSRGLATRQMPIDLPVGPDYILGSGDGISISLWGGISQNFSRTVDREGKIVLPEAGTITVAGLSLEHTQSIIQNVLSQQFKDAHVSVSIAHLRTVRVYVVGDVQRPGAYDISSLSTPLNALYAAGGPTAVGSLRTIRQYRGKNLIREVDLYDFLLHGIRADADRLEPGDTILVPPVGSEVAIAGMVKRPAIYEFKETVNLSDVLNEAGGVLVSAALTHITVERVEKSGNRITLSPDISSSSTSEEIVKKINAFSIQNGDRVTVAPILPYSEKAVYVEGHVVRPGKFPYRDGMLLSEVIKSYQDLLPEPAEHGEIVRLVPPDLHAETIEFSVPDILNGNDTVHLQPFDTIRITGRYEADAPKVTIRGEVVHPGIYALSMGETTDQLVKMAGGFKRSALTDDADLVSYELRERKHVVTQRTSINIGEALRNPSGNNNVLLKPGDVLTIHQVTGWNDIGASVIINGEVTYPGSYGLKEGERLSSVLLRAGGFRATAYPAGAVLVRPQVKELEEKSRAELIRQLESTSAGARLAPSLTGADDAATLQILTQQQNEMIRKLRNQPAIGRLVIKVDMNISHWAGTDADVELRAGDVLTIPKKPGFVLVSGQVYNSTAITFVPGKNAGWYLKRAGGSTDLSNRKEIIVIRANGSVIGRRSGGWYDPGVLETRLDPGDVVVVPQKIFGGGVFWRNLFVTAQLSSSIGLAAALALR